MELDGSASNFALAFNAATSGKARQQMSRELDGSRPYQKLKSRGKIVSFRVQLRQQFV